MQDQTEGARSDTGRFAHISLPRPISVNNLYANVAGKGRVKASAYNTWLWQAEAALALQKPLPKFAGPVDITICVGEEGVGRMDADNCSKAYLDLLKTKGVIRDDSRQWVRSVRIVWISGMAGAVASISAAGASEAAADMWLASIPASIIGERARNVEQPTTVKPGPEAPVLPPHPFWTPERDALVFRSSGHYPALSDVARELGASTTAVVARWHKLRTAR